MKTDRSSLEACIARVAAAGRIGRAGALDILQKVADRAEDTGDPAIKAAGKLAGRLRETAKADRLDALRNVVKRGQWQTRALNEAEGRIAPGVSANLNPFQTKFTLADGFRSVLHWMEGAKQRDNVQSLWHDLEGRLIAPLGNRLRALGLQKAAEADAYRYEVAEALWRKNGGAPDERVTISKNAQQIADAMAGPLDLIKQRQNAEGARIGDAIDYVTHTNWNPDQLRRAAGPGADIDAARAAWKAKDGPRIAEKTFADLVPRPGESVAEARDRFLTSVYDATRSGVHMRGPAMAGMASDGDGYIPPIYEGTHNIGRSVSQPRVVYWKSSADWADHMRDFGGGESMLANVQRTLSVGARRTALMHYLGTNPEANFETLIGRTRETIRNSDELPRFDRQIEGVRNTLGRLTGKFNMPIHDDAGMIFEPLMALEATTHLGGISLTHVAASPLTFGGELAHHGVNRLDGLAAIGKALLTTRGDEVGRQAALADSGAYARSYVMGVRRAMSFGEAWSRDGLPGWSSRAAASFTHWTGIEQILPRIQAGAIRGVLMDRLGQAIDGEFSALEEHQRAGLAGYGIGPDEWRLLGTSSAPSVVEGRRWVVPSDALASDKAAVEAVLRARGELGQDASPQTIDQAVQKFQWDLGDKLGMYLSDAADHAAVRAGAREQAIILGNARPGSIEYMVRRTLGQFKMWPLAAVTQRLGRDIADLLSKKDMAAKIFTGIVLGTIGGALRMSVNDVAMGRPQRDYSNPMTLLAAAAQGGGLGIYGDFLFGETSRLGAGLMSTVSGPLGADADRFISMLNRWKADLKTEPGKAMQHLWPDLAHFAVGYVPFANLVYLKGTLDYLLWYHLYEAASPGWWERTNRRLARWQGRVMTGYVPGGRIPYTPMGLGSPTMQVPARR